MITLFYGGASSGKSSLAEDYAVKKANSDLCYIATMMPFGEEGARKIASHKIKREGKGFAVCEQYVDVEKASVCGTVLLECMGNLIANEMFSHEVAIQNVCEHIAKSVRSLAKKCDNLVIVSSDLSCGGENLSAESLEYVANTEKINGMIAELCGEVYRVVAGIAVREK